MRKITKHCWGSYWSTKEIGPQTKKNKCIFEPTRIKFLGHTGSANGLEAGSDKVEAIRATKTPRKKKWATKTIRDNHIPK